jgi:hypothetical protein
MAGVELVGAGAGGRGRSWLVWECLCPWRVVRQSASAWAGSVPPSQWWLVTPHPQAGPVGLSARGASKASTPHLCLSVMSQNSPTVYSEQAPEIPLETVPLSTSVCCSPGRAAPPTPVQDACSRGGGGSGRRGPLGGAEPSRQAGPSPLHEARCSPTTTTSGRLAAPGNPLRAARWWQHQRPPCTPPAVFRTVRGSDRWTSQCTYFCRPALHALLYKCKRMCSRRASAPVQPRAPTPASAACAAQKSRVCVQNLATRERRNTSRPAQASFSSANPAVYMSLQQHRHHSYRTPQPQPARARRAASPGPGPQQQGQARAGRCCGALPRPAQAEIRQRRRWPLMHACCAPNEITHAPHNQLSPAAPGPRRQRARPAPPQGGTAPQAAAAAAAPAAPASSPSRAPYSGWILASWS